MTARKTYHPQMTNEQRDAWIAGLTPSQRRLIGIPVGWMYTAVIAAISKRWLTLKIGDDERLMILEHLNNSVDGISFTEEMLRTIEPMTDLGQKMVDEAIRAFGGVHVKSRPNILDFFAEVEVFDALCQASPSLQRAVNIHVRHHAA